MKLSTFLTLTMFALSCTSASEEIEKQAMAARTKGGSSSTLVDGMAIYRKNCITCHGADGKLGLNGAKDLSASILPLHDRIQIITNGKNLMTPFKSILSEEEIKAVAEYSVGLSRQSDK
ncbi:MAG: c-type cytochrome [Chitinophagales bacterium]|jgi:mono/diheme cytochrome c family protein